MNSWKARATRETTSATIALLGGILRDGGRCQQTRCSVCYVENALCPRSAIQGTVVVAKWLPSQIGSQNQAGKDCGMKVGVKFKTDKFLFALRAKKAAVNGAYPDILNKAALNVAFRASSYTPKGDSNKIRASLMRDPHLRYALTALQLKKRGVGALKAPEFAKAVERFVSRRASSANYLRAAWAQAVQNLGGTFRGAKFAGANEGFANKATVTRLIAEIVAVLNQPTAAKAASAEDVLQRAVQSALDFVADDMLEYAQRKLAQAAAV